MQFTVPQFIEKEPKIVGPFTFKQFIFIGSAGAICFFLYFATPLPFFIILTIILLSSAFALAFVKIEKISLPVIIKNFFIFLFKPKIYLWKKKQFAQTIIKAAEKKEEEDEIVERTEKTEAREAVLKIGSGSRLRKLLTSIETKK
jgi:hypothetical protein